jgi:citrate lyase subunit beta/citryl-CoA lyase
VLTPTPAEVERAQRVLGRAEAADGGVFVDDDGRMIDEAVLRSARRVLARARP